MESSVFDGEGSLDRVISDKEVEDEHAVQDWEDFPGEEKKSEVHCHLLIWRHLL